MNPTATATSANQQFAALMQLPESQIDVAEAALLIAQHEYPMLDVAAAIAQLDDLSRAAAARLGGRSGGRQRIEALNDFLFTEQGFHGNRDDYYDPRNSYLNDVIERRCGIPITLSLVYTEVGQRLGLPVYGVCFPGHFLVKYADPSEEVLVDAFQGCILSHADCERRLQTVYGSRAKLSADLLRAASSREIIARVLRNLKQTHLERQDWPHALQVCELLLLVIPDSPDELRDRGALFQRLECFAAALADFERLLQLAPDDAQAEAVRAQLPGLRQAVARLN